MTAHTRMDVYVKGILVFAYFRGTGSFDIDDVEVEIYDDELDNRR